MEYANNFKDSCLAFFTQGNNNKINFRDLNFYDSRRFAEQKKLNNPALPKEERFFIGRNEQLETLKNLVFKDNLKKIAVCGLPGIGKSELVNHFVRWCDQSNGIPTIWLNFESDEEFKKSLKEYVKNTVHIHSPNLRSTLQSLYKKYSGTTIVVFDNVPNRQKVLHFEPVSDKFICLYTCHNNAWGGNVKTLTLSELTLKSSLDILKHNLGDIYNQKDVPLYKNIIEYYGKFPLVLQYIANYLKMKLPNIPNLTLEKCSSDPKIIKDILKLPLKNSGILHPKTIFSSMEFIFKKINQNCLNLVFQFVHLNPDDLDYNMLLENDKGGKLNKSIIVLQEYGLIKYKEDKFFISNVTLKTAYMFLSTKNEIKENIYKDCLEFILKPDYISHIPHILRYYDEIYVDLFFKFYKQHERAISNLKFNDKPGLCFILECLVKNNNVKALQKLFFYFGSLKSKDLINDYNLLHIAVTFSVSKTVEFILRQKPDLYKQNTEGLTAIQVAALKWKKLSISKMLPKVNYTKDENGNTLLHYFGKGAINFDKIDIKLAKKIIYELLQKQNIYEITNNNGETILHQAAATFNTNFIKLLFNEYKFPPNVQDNNLNTPLHAMVMQAPTCPNKKLVIETANLLWRNGADLKLVNSCNKTVNDLVSDHKVIYLNEILNSNILLSYVQYLVFTIFCINLIPMLVSNIISFIINILQNIVNIMAAIFIIRYVIKNAILWLFRLVKPKQRDFPD